MANLFYGVSTTEADVSQKEVTIYNPLHDNILPGDLLVVYFSDSNTVESPTLVIQGTSLSSGENNQTSLSEDEGIVIKSRNVEEEIDYMWQAGEVCIFVLISQQTNSDLTQEYNSVSQTSSTANDALYYMFVRSSRAGSEYYGLTKLFTDSFNEEKNYKDFKTWLATEDAPEDKTTAATPYLIKQLSNFIIGKFTPPEPEPSPGPEPEPESESETQPVLQIEYTQIAPEETCIGNLRVGETVYGIYIPAAGGGSGGGGVYTRTSQFTNDADLENNGITYSHKRTSPIMESNSGYYFITNVIDNDLYLYKPTTQTTGLYLASPAPSGTTLNNGPNSNDQKTIKSPVEGTMIAKPLISREQTGNGCTVLNDGFRTTPLYVKGSGIHFYSDSNAPTNPTLSLNPTYNSSRTDFYAPRFFENGTLLSNKYSRTIGIRAFKIGGGNTSAGTGTFMYWANGQWNWGRSGWTKPATASANGNTGHMQVTVNAGLGGVMPLGIIGYDLNYSSRTNINSTSGGNSSDGAAQRIWELYLSGQGNGTCVVHYNTHNQANRTTYFSIVIYVLVVAV